MVQLLGSLWNLYQLRHTHAELAVGVLWYLYQLRHTHAELAVGVRHVRVIHVRIPGQADGSVHHAVGPLDAVNAIPLLLVLLLPFRFPDQQVLLAVNAKVQVVGVDDGQVSDAFLLILLLDYIRLQ
jgi:hypothetical protein